MEGLIGVGTIEELGLFFPSVVLKELGVRDSIDIDVLGQLGGGFSIERVMVRDIGGVGEVKVFGLV